MFISFALIMLTLISGYFHLQNPAQNCPLVLRTSETISVQNARLLGSDLLELVSTKTTPTILWLSDGRGFLSYSGGVLRIFCSNYTTSNSLETLDLSQYHFSNVALSASGRYLAGVSIYDKKLTVVEIDTHQAKQFSLPYLSTVAFSPDEQRIAVGDGRGKISIFDSSTLTVHGETTLTEALEDNGVTALLFSPDGALISGHQAGNIYVWDTQNLQWPTAILKSSTVFDLDISANGVLVATVLGRETDWPVAKVWYHQNEIWEEVATKISYPELYHADIAVNPQGDMIVIGYSDGILNGYAIETGDLLFSTEYRKTSDDEQIDVRFSPDGTRLTIASRGHITVFSLR